MKVLMTILCLIASVMLAVPPQPARAATFGGREYARADSRLIYFCSNMDDNTALFALPYTYCVEILADHGEWYLVRYARDEGMYEEVTGYCRKSGLTPLTTLPDNIYLNYPVQATLRSDVPQNSPLPGLEITITAAYYGVYYDGAASYSYVLYDGSFRYIAGAIEDYPLNEFIQDTFTETEKTPEEESNAKLITAIVVSLIAASAVIVLVFTGKRRIKK